MDSRFKRKFLKEGGWLFSSVFNAKVIKEFFIEEGKDGVWAEVSAGDSGKSTCHLIGRFGALERVSSVGSVQVLGKIQKKPGGGERTTHTEKMLELHTIGDRDKMAIN